MKPILRIKNLSAGYGSLNVLHGLSFSMAPSENIGFFGPNGHGKTTLMRAISGLISARSGSIEFNSVAINNIKPSAIVASGLVHAQQGNTLFGDMGVAETIELSAFTQRAKKQASQNKERVYSLFPRLAERRKQKAKTLSGGERQMLSISAALMCEPSLLLLDEPTLGLSPRLKEELSETLATISESVPMVLVEQDVALLLAITDRLALIEHGEIVREITKDNAPDHEEIINMYFGEHA